MSSDDELDRLGAAMRGLRTEYEKYFMGIERLEPLKARDELKKMMRQLMNEPAKNTARRFRLQTLQASLISYESHWNRITRQIEEGTFKRDRLRAQAILAADDEQAPPAANPPGEAAKAPLPPGAAAARPAAAPAEADYPEAIRKLHEAFEQARRDSGGTAKPLSIAALAATVNKQTAAITAQYNCKTVEFKVAVKDGKPILKAVPKS